MNTTSQIKELSTKKIEEMSQSTKRGAANDKYSLNKTVAISSKLEGTINQSLDSNQDQIFPS